MIEQKFTEAERGRLRELVIAAVAADRGDPQLNNILAMLSGTDTVLLASRAYPATIRPADYRLSDAEIGRDMARLSNAERLARAVLMFHEQGEWTAQRRAEWLAITGSDAATTRILCNLARQVRTEEEENRNVG